MRMLAALLVVILQVPRPVPPPIPPEALSQFDFLDGAWEFTYTVKNPDGTIATSAKGRWTGRRLADGRLIEDSWMLVDDDGKPRGPGIYTFRAFNTVARKWQFKAINLSTGLWQEATAEKVGSEMHLIQSPPAERPDGNWLRIRYYNITPDAFSWVADVGDGKTWVPELIRIEAKRARQAGSSDPKSTVFGPGVDHSARSTTAGSTRLAQRAGM